MEKSLDKKLAEIHANPNSKAFILADAKDADMAFGIRATGRPDAARSPEHADGGYRSIEEYREQIRANVAQGLLDIMLMSVSNNEILTINDRLFDQSAVTPAVRANDTTDIHTARGSAYGKQPALPFRTALLDHALCGRLACEGGTAERRGADLGLYSVTFNNDVHLDQRTLEAYRQFRVEAESKGFRHFLEVFDPNAPIQPIPDELLGGFINDQIVRTLAGVASPGRPIFLKIVYHGPKFMEELANYDRHLVPGILGGASGTTYDAFKLLAEAKAHGARAALFGRKINNAEHQLTFIQFLRYIADEQASPQEAVRAYHGVLQGMGIRPQRTLEEDMQLTNPAVSYSGSTRVTSFSPAQTTAKRQATAAPASSSLPSGGGSGRGDVAPRDAKFPTKPDGSPDFSKMTSQQRVEYHRRRLGMA